MVTLNKEQLKIWQEQDLEHLRYEYDDIKPRELVLDIGSYRREFAVKIGVKYSCNVECFDALDHKAAWTHDGELSMGGQYYYTSMMEKESAQTKYRCVDIKQHLQSEVALMKINIEGGEYELLAHIITNDLIKNVRNLQVQFHQLEDLPKTELLYELISLNLKKTHDLKWRYPFVWESWTRKS